MITRLDATAVGLLRDPLRPHAGLCYAASVLPKLTLPLAIVVSLVGCKNEDYEKCLENEKQALEKLKKAMDACDQLPDEAKKTECREQAKSGHFEAGCEALK